MVIFVVLQHVGVACQTATAKNKPPLLPCLQGEHRNKAKGYFVRSNNDCSIPDRPQTGQMLYFSILANVFQA